MLSKLVTQTLAIDAIIIIAKSQFWWNLQKLMSDFHRPDHILPMWGRDWWSSYVKPEDVCSVLSEIFSIMPSFSLAVSKFCKLLCWSAVRSVPTVVYIPYNRYLCEHDIYASKTEDNLFMVRIATSHVEPRGITEIAFFGPKCTNFESYQRGLQHFPIDDKWQAIQGFDRSSKVNNLSCGSYHSNGTSSGFWAIPRFTLSCHCIALIHFPIRSVVWMYSMRQ